MFKSMEMNLDYVLYMIGVVTLSYWSLKLLRNIYHAWSVYFSPTYPDFSKYGKWSVITGSTDGIGKAIATKLASKGQNVILIARSEAKLKNVAKEIASKHGVDTRFLQIDFTDEEHIYETIEQFLRDFDIGVLVNNVGMGVGPYRFHEIPNLSQGLTHITRVNMFSMLKMCQIILPRMVERNRGIIINISSGSVVAPLLTVYGATKAFAHYFSQALSYEYQDRGITIQSCLPFHVETNMSQDLSKSFFTRTPDEYATSLLATVDKERVTEGCWQHALQCWIFKQFPHDVLRNALRGKFNATRRNYEKRKDL